MYKSTSILLLLTFFALSSAQVQSLFPLCGTDGKTEHVADPASCHSYLFCQWDTVNKTQLNAVHQLDCRAQNSNHFEPTADGISGNCVAVRPHCTDSSFFCPDADFMVANPLDPDCREFRPCRLPGFPWMNCRSPLLFNRNTGACDHAANAPCGGIVNTPTCPPLLSGFFPGQFCWSYIFCFEGTQIGDELNCPTGWKFDESISDCAEDTAGVCIRPTFAFIPPRVRNGVSRKQKKEIYVKIEGF